MGAYDAAGTREFRSARAHAVDIWRRDTLVLIMLLSDVERTTEYEREAIDDQVLYRDPTSTSSILIREQLFKINSSRWLWKLRVMLRENL